MEADLQDPEFSFLSNIMPETAEEAKTLQPTLQVRRPAGGTLRMQSLCALTYFRAATKVCLGAQSIDDERIQALLDDMAKYKKFE